MEAEAPQIPYKYEVRGFSEDEPTMLSAKADGIDLPNSPDAWGAMNTRDVFAINCILGKEAITVSEADQISGREGWNTDQSRPFAFEKWKFEQGIASINYRNPSILKQQGDLYALGKIPFEDYLAAFEAERGPVQPTMREAFRDFTDATFAPAQRAWLLDNPFALYKETGQYCEVAQPLTPEVIDDLAAPDRHILARYPKGEGSLYASIFRIAAGGPLVQFLPNTAEFGGSAISIITPDDLENLSPDGPVISKWQPAQQ